MNRNKKYHYFYKITNNINNHFYYGVHNTDNLDDGYMGSGHRLHLAYKKYGIENFSKEILKFFDTKKEAFEYEAEVVNEVLVNDPNCYNIAYGGQGGSGEHGEKCLGWIEKGALTVRDKNGNTFRCKCDDPKYISGEYVPLAKNYRKYKNKITGKQKFFHKDEIIDSSIWEVWSKGLISVEDKNGKIFMVSKADPRYLNGELKFTFTKYNSDPKVIEKKKRIYKEIKHQQGEKNSQYGTCWIYNEQENKKIKKEELEDYINKGWKQGRKMKLHNK